jgi:hypothetical protein
MRDFIVATIERMGLAQNGMNPKNSGCIQTFHYPFRSVRARINQQAFATPARINLVKFIYQYVKELKVKVYPDRANIRCNSKKSRGVYVYRYEYPFINAYLKAPLSLQQLRT